MTGTFTLPYGHIEGFADRLTGKETREEYAKRITDHEEHRHDDRCSIPTDPGMLDPDAEQEKRQFNKSCAECVNAGEDPCALFTQPLLVNRTRSFSRDPSRLIIAVVLTHEQVFIEGVNRHFPGVDTTSPGRKDPLNSLQCELMQTWNRHFSEDVGWAGPLADLQVINPWAIRAIIYSMSASRPAELFMGCR